MIDLDEAISEQPSRGEGPFIKELSLGCIGLSTAYRHLSLAIFKKELKVSFLNHCIEHDEAYWYGGTERQRLAADLRLYNGIKNTASKPYHKFLYSPVACIMFGAVRLLGSPKLPTPFRWMRGVRYNPFLSYTVEDVAKDSTVDTVVEATTVIKILNDSPSSTVSEAVKEYYDLVNLNDEMNLQNGYQVDILL